MAAGRGLCSRRSVIMRRHTQIPGQYGGQTGQGNPATTKRRSNRRAIRPWQNGGQTGGQSGRDKTAGALLPPSPANDDFTVW